MVECSASDPEMWVRFPLPAPIFILRSDAEVVITVLTRNQLEALSRVGSNPTHSAKIKRQLKFLQDSLSIRKVETIDISNLS